MNSNNISIKVLTKSNFSKNYDMGQIPAGYFAMSGIRGHVFNEETAKEGLKSTLITFVVVLLRQTLAVMKLTHISMIGMLVKVNSQRLLMICEMKNKNKIKNKIK